MANLLKWLIIVFIILAYVFIILAYIRFASIKFDEQSSF